MTLPKYIDSPILTKHCWAAGEKKLPLPITELAWNFQELQFFNMKSWQAKRNILNIYFNLGKHLLLSTRIKTNYLIPELISGQVLWSPQWLGWRRAGNKLNEKMGSPTPPHSYSPTEVSKQGLSFPHSQRENICMRKRHKDRKTAMSPFLQAWCYSWPVYKL